MWKSRLMLILIHKYQIRSQFSGIQSESNYFQFRLYSNNYKFSFPITTIKLLILFLHNYLILTKKDFSTKFKNVNYLLNYYVLYIKHLNSWS